MTENAPTPKQMHDAYFALCDHFKARPGETLLMAAARAHSERDHDPAAVAVLCSVGAPDTWGTWSALVAAAALLPRALIRLVPPERGS